jgi:hypothetical protein
VQPRCLPFYSASKAAQVITGTVCSVVEYVTDESISNAKVVLRLDSYRNHKAYSEEHQSFHYLFTWFPEIADTSTCLKTKMSGAMVTQI